MNPADRATRVDVAARTLLLDAEAARLSAACRGRGMRAILLRGPAIARWLYAQGGRVYMDVDLLVAPDSQHEAEDVLVARGFERGPFEAPGQQARAWHRPVDGAQVDLHVTLVGIQKNPEAAWQALSTGTGQLTVAGQEVEVLGLPQRALLVALHAAQHGAGEPKPLADLGRAVAAVSDDVWREAAEVAHSLDAVAAFALGLRMVPEGAELADHLRLPERVTVEAALRAGTAVDLTLGLERMAQMSGWRERASFVRRRVFPSAAFMRASSPLARRGPLGLGLAYVTRPVSLLARLPRALVAWLRARRLSR